jgi:hypothetical protein
MVVNFIGINYYLYKKKKENILKNPIYRWNGVTTVRIKKCKPGNTSIPSVILARAD